MAQAGIQSGFLAEVPGKTDHADRTRLAAVQRFQLSQCSITAAVIHKNDFIGVTAALKGGYDSLLKGGYVFFFVVAWNNQRQLHVHFHPFS